jgi:hypothetical protein
MAERVLVAYRELLARSAEAVADSGGD